MKEEYKPWSSSAEQAVITAIADNQDRLEDISFLKSKDFYHRVHQQVFEMMQDMRNKGEFFDTAIIAGKFSEDMGGMSYFADMMKTRSSHINYIAYARQVLEFAVRRNSMDKYSDAIARLRDNNETSLDVISDVDESVTVDIARLSSGNYLTIDDLINHSLECMDHSSTELSRGISTGIPEIDKQLGYRLMAYGEITAFGALSKNGKTLFANTVLARAELKENEVAKVFSVEMPAVGMFNAIISAKTGVPSNFYDRQAFYLQKYPELYDSWIAKWGIAAQEIRDNGKVTIDDKKECNVDYIVAEIRKHHSLLANKGKKLRLVMIDHFHRLDFDCSKKSMTYVMGDDAKKLKNVAAELDLSIGLLVQLKEDCKDRTPTAYDILDTSRLRHEIQCFIGFKMYRDNGGTYFGISSDTHRYADNETVFDTQYVKLAAGVIRSLGEGEHFNPSQNQNEGGY